MKKKENKSDLIKKLRKQERHETRKEEAMESPKTQKLERKYKIEKHLKKK